MTAAHAQTTEGPPRPPLNSAPGRVLPVRDAAGHYATPNRDLSPTAAAWHVRAALNVAALSCRDLAPDATVAAYNGMLVQDRAALAADNLALIGEYRARYGAEWQSHYDAEMTQLYSFFAEPGAYRPFCTAAREVLSAVASVAVEDFNAFAAGQLAKLEAPITDFYDDYARYQVANATWQQAHAPAMAGQPVLATTSPAPVTIAQPAPVPVTIAQPAAASIASPMVEAPVAVAVAPSPVPAVSVAEVAPILH